MRSEGFSFKSGGLGVEPCSILFLFFSDQVSALGAEPDFPPRVWTSRRGFDRLDARTPESPAPDGLGDRVRKTWIGRAGAQLILSHGKFPVLKDR